MNAAFPSAPTSESMMARNAPTVLDVGLILRMVARRYRVSVEEIRGRRRTRELAPPRQIAIWLSRRLLPGRTLTEIGRAMNRDHTTVMASLDRAEDRRAWDPEFAADLARMEADLRALAPVPDEDQVAALRTAAVIAGEVNTALIREAARDPHGFMDRVSRLFTGLDAGGEAAGRAGARSSDAGGEAAGEVTP